MVAGARLVGAGAALIWVAGETSSLRVATLLQRLGVPDARALTGGWVDWFNDGNPIARD